jgi:predicted dehydrogenase
LLSACVALMGAQPTRLWTCALDFAGLTSLVLEFPAGRAAQVNLWAAPRPARCRFEAVAERGTATALLPGDLMWHDGEGRHSLRLPRQKAERTLLEQFVQGVRSGEPLQHTFEQSYQALTWLRAARRSQAEGRGIEIPSAASG